MKSSRAIRIIGGALLVGAVTWLLLPADAGGIRLTIGMFLIGVVGGAVMYWRWSPLLVPVAIWASFGLRNWTHCPDCPVGDGPPWIVGMIIVVAVMLIPASGAVIGGGIVGLVDEFRD